jgi:hypothetical protein
MADPIARRTVLGRGDACPVAGAIGKRVPPQWPAISIALAIAIVPAAALACDDDPQRTGPGPSLAKAIEAG